MKPVRNETAGKPFWHTKPTVANGKDRQHDQRNRHRPGSLLGVLRFWCARLAQKGKGNLAHGVKRGQEGGDGERDEYGQVPVEGARQNFILGPETGGQYRKAGKRKATD